MDNYYANVAQAAAKKNTEQKTGPKRDARGRVSGGNPGNTGGKKGRSGRKPEAFANFLAKLRQDPKLHEALESAVTDPNSRGFSSALKVLTDYDDQKPAQKIEVSEPMTTAERERRIRALLGK